jgi:hypothetical protein
MLRVLGRTLNHRTTALISVVVIFGGQAPDLLARASRLAVATSAPQSEVTALSFAQASRKLATESPVFCAEAPEIVATQSSITTDAFDIFTIVVLN